MMKFVASFMQHFNDHPGSLDNPWFPVNRRDAESQFEDFLKQEND